MNKKFTTVSGALALTFMLLVGGAAFAHATNASKAKAKVSAAEMPSVSNNRRRKRHHRRRMRREMKREKREMRRERKEKR